MSICISCTRSKEPRDQAHRGLNGRVGVQWCLWHATPRVSSLKGMEKLTFINKLLNSLLSESYLTWNRTQQSHEANGILRALITKRQLSVHGYLILLWDYLEKFRYLSFVCALFVEMSLNCSILSHGLGVWGHTCMGIIAPVAQYRKF